VPEAAGSVLLGCFEKRGLKRLFRKISPIYPHFPFVHWCLTQKKTISPLTCWGFLDCTRQKKLTRKKFSWIFCATNFLKIKKKIFGFFQSKKKFKKIHIRKVRSDKPH
jgi:hypothetical protein